MDPNVTRPGARASRGPRAAPSALRRRRPRAFEEWKALASWGKLPPWEGRAPGYQLRLARESAGLTQAELAERLGVSQQAVARAERWASNPTVRFIEQWALALGARLVLAIEREDESREETA